MDKLTKLIIDGDMHNGGVKTLEIYEVPNFEKIKNECLNLYKNFKSSDVTQINHRTFWTKPYGGANQWDLFNESGVFDSNEGIGVKNIKNKKFHHNKIFPNLGEFINSWPDKINFRLNLLSPGSGLGQHEEQIIENYQNEPFIRIRFHLPIITNKECNVFLDGDWYHFFEKYVYFFNNGCVHCAENNSKEDRLHLVWDCMYTKNIRNILERGKTIKPIRHSDVDPNFARMKRIHENPYVLNFRFRDNI